MGAAVEVKRAALKTAALHSHLKTFMTAHGTPQGKARLPR